ncbi:hypothetical protein [Arthrobacter sp. KK5.5]|uniref:hypothetical protein n=1 Tax=Arthrobacter sp. KK5.5 TaxID=3373084 RepID=UPI003EE802DB
MPRSPDPSVPTSSSSGDPSGAGPSETTSADPAAPTSGTAEPTSSAPAQSPPAGNAAGSLSVSPQGDGSNLVLLSEPDGGFAGPVRVSLTVADGTLLDRAAEGTDCDRVGSSLWRCDVADAQTLQFLVRASGASDGGPVTLRVEATDGAERTFAGDVTLPSVG